ncbi:putative membrane protein [Nostoc sp. PCC 7524]|uniref:TMEM165/GDT1 family protein n=1 Tax=Nostoc sp. (strain ATCC 29411 / PCC 7524) TaxID=28072 RepID=UPI00029EEA00|nr:TMEM165/GDT1 family protein [Nostoc sp. PCC 7524]AFY47993.1 putative membrane protein [Nostoc sp. PCC 7524]
MKLDSAPVILTGLSASASQPELTATTEPTTIETIQPVASADSQKKQDSPIVVFGTTFITIFLAEIGDKTQLSTLLMSAESHAPWVVFLGSAAALITTSLLGVLLGSWISKQLSPKALDKSAGVMLLLVSVMLFWDVLQG